MLGVTFNRQGKSAEALKAYREALRLNPTGVDELNDLAWFLATDPHDELRNGKEAVELGRKACELTENHVASCLGTLDGAYAETGQFREAIETAKRTERAATAAGQEELAKAARKRLELYEAGKPYRQPPIEVGGR